jgi:hypothetical protein
MTSLPLMSDFWSVPLNSNTKIITVTAIIARRTWAIHLLVFEADHAPLDGCHLLFSLPELQHDDSPDHNEDSKGNLNWAAEVVDGNDVDLQWDSDEGRGREPQVVVSHKGEVEADLLTKIFLKCNR